MKGCSSGKIPFSTRAEANTMKKKAKGRYGNTSPYLCGECKLWHLGRKIPKHVQRGIRRHMEGKFPDERRLDA